MRIETKEIKIYSFDELSENAKQNAFDKYIQNPDVDLVIDEYFTTLKKFAEIMNIKINDYYIGSGYRDYINWNFYYSNTEHETIENYIRLYKCFMHNYYSWFTKCRYYSKWNNGKSISRHSKTRYFDFNCLTGNYCDESITDVIYNFVTGISKVNTLEQLIDECINNLLDNLNKDIEYYSSYEYFNEKMTDNNIEFLQDGTIY